MKSSAPTETLSILLLCWNHARFLETCISSMASQTSRNFEIVFLDNFSDDNSYELAVTLFEQYGLTAKMLRNDCPQPISVNLNRLLNVSSTDLVAVLSTDDWYAPRYVEVMQHAAARYPASAIFAPNGWSAIENGNLIPSNSPPLENELVGDAFLFDRDFFFWVGLCYRRSSLQAVGGWDNDQVIEDMDLLFRLTKKYRVTQLNDRLVYYRRSETSVSLDPVFMAEGRFKFFVKHKSHFGSLWNTLVAEMLRSSAAVAIDQNRIADSITLILRSIALKPLSLLTYKTLFYLVRSTIRRRR